MLMLINTPLIIVLLQTEKLARLISVVHAPFHAQLAECMQKSLVPKCTRDGQVAAERKMFGLYSAPALTVHRGGFTSTHAPFF